MIVLILSLYLDFFILTVGIHFIHLLVKNEQKSHPIFVQSCFNKYNIEKSKIGKSI